MEGKSTPIFVPSSTPLAPLGRPGNVRGIFFARLNVQERGLDGAVVRPSGFHKRGYENVSQAASTMFWDGFPKDRGREEVTLLCI